MTIVFVDMTGSLGFVTIRTPIDFKKVSTGKRQEIHANTSSKRVTAPCSCLRCFGFLAFDATADQAKSQRIVRNHGPEGL